MFRRRSSSDNDARILIANSLVDIDPDYAVSASDLPNRGTGGSGYDLDTNVGTAANRKIHPSGSCLLFGASGDYVSTPDSAANSITGDIDIRWFGFLDDWTPAAFSTLVAKDNYGVAGNGSFALTIATDGTVHCVFDLGTSRVEPESTVPTGFSNGSTGGVRVTRNATTGATNFYTSTDGVTWTLLGDGDLSSTTGSINDTSIAVAIGASSNGTLLRASGGCFWAQIYDGIDGTLAVDFDPTNYVSGTTFSSGGVTWTLNGNSFIQNTGHDVLHSIGSNGLETAAGQSISNPVTVFCVGRVSSAPAADAYFFNARSNGLARLDLIANATAGFRTFNGSSVLSVAGSYDTSPHVFTLQSNGDATTKLTVSGAGSITGNAGSNDWDFASVLCALDGSQSLAGYIARLLVFDYALSETQVSAIQSYLSAYYSL